MRRSPNLTKHPSRHQLFAYAENLVDEGRTLDAAIAGHIARCERCSAEVTEIRRSLDLVAQAPPLERGNEAVSQILMAAKRERGVGRKSVYVATLMRGVGYAAAMLVVAGLAFSLALGDPSAPATAEAKTDAASAADPAPTVARSPESLREKAEEVATLAAAVRSTNAEPLSVRERERLRTVSQLDNDIAAAKAALQRNPGCVRATHIVHANLERQAEELRSLYVERAL